MEYTKLGPVEGRFADLIWENAPVTTAQLVALARDALDWKRTTTYTVLKRLCDRGLFLLENGTVTAQLSREEFYAQQSREYVDASFDGSLPAFLAAFTTRKSLTEEEIRQIRALIDNCQEG